MAAMVMVDVGSFCFLKLDRLSVAKLVGDILAGGKILLGAL
jgi:hypothetical protein